MWASGSFPSYTVFRVRVGAGIGHRSPRGLSFPGLVVHNVSVRGARLAFASLAVGIGVMAVVTFAVIDHSLRSSALAIVQTGRADFTISQKGVSDLLSSNIDIDAVNRIRAYPGVAGATGVLVGTTKLNSSNPQFLEFGIDPSELSDFGVTITDGRAFGATVDDELMLGADAAHNLHKKVGDSITVEGRNYHVVGLFVTGQAYADTGAALPLVSFQGVQRQASEVTLVFVRMKPGGNMQSTRNQIEHDNSQLVTIRTASDFGRADRSLALINAADKGSTVLAIGVGAVIVMTTMTMAFLERTREFGVLAAVGWSRLRIMTMVLSEALCIGVVGAGIGVALSFGATEIIGQLPSLVGILHPDYTADAFRRALYTAAAMSILGGAYPAARAARLSPLEALRRE